jgi:hypothetical protein
MSDGTNSTLAKLLAAPSCDDMTRKVEELGVEITVRCLPYDEVNECLKDGGFTKNLPSLLARTVFDGDGSPVFTQQDATEFLKKPWHVVSPIALAVMRANGLTDEAADDIRGNLQSTT